MIDPRTVKLAQLLVDYSVAVRPGDWVLVRGNAAARPLIEETVRYVLRAGGRPNVQITTDMLDEIILRESSEDQLDWLSPTESLLFEKTDCLISIRAAENTRALSGVDPEKQRRQQNARKGIMQSFMERSAQGSMRWVSTLYPCPAYAQEADMSMGDYADFVYRATFVDQPDPVTCWAEVHQTQQRLVDWLKGKQRVTVKGTHVDLSLSIKGRTFINSDGHHNMPSGEIFTGPVEDSANGWVRFTYPAIQGGREVEGVELEFKQGKVVRASAEKNQDYLVSLLDSDPGARFLGEFAIGTNYGIDRFTKSILFDEKIGGTFHLAVGAGYPETGSLNRSSLHWDFICDLRVDSEIRVDGELFYQNGQFTL